MRSRDRRTKRDTAFRRGGFMPLKPSMPPPIPASRGRNGGRRTPIKCVNFVVHFQGFAFTLLSKHWEYAN